MSKAPWEAEKAPAPVTPAPQPDPVESTVVAKPDDPIVNEEGPGVDEEALEALKSTIDGDQAPLELVNLVSNGMPMAEAKALLGLE